MLSMFWLSKKLHFFPAINIDPYSCFSRGHQITKKHENSSFTNIRRYFSCFFQTSLIERVISTQIQVFLPLRDRGLDFSFFDFFFGFSSEQLFSNWSKNRSKGQNDLAEASSENPKLLLNSPASLFSGFAIPSDSIWWGIPRPQRIPSRTNCVPIEQLNLHDCMIVWN